MLHLMVRGTRLVQQQSDSSDEWALINIRGWRSQPISGTLMGWIALIVGVVVLIPIAMIMLGALWPSRPAMTALIEIELKNAGLDRTAFSDECIKELADLAVRTTEFQAQFEKGANRLVNSHLEEKARTTANIVYWILVGSQPNYTAKDIRAAVAKGTEPIHWRILAKHDPNRYSLDRLELTQNHNAALREEISELHSKKPPF